MNSDDTPAASAPGGPDAELSPLSEPDRLPDRPPAGESKTEPGEAPGKRARRLMRFLDRATLATSERASLADEVGGWPYPSLVLVALDHDGSPLLLLSDLADHSKNAAADSRAGLLFDGTIGLASPLAGARVSVLGRLARSAEPRHRARFLARHPDAALYAGFRDFGIYKLSVERAHLVAGFGRIHWVKAAELLIPDPPPSWAEAEADILATMNGDQTAGVQRIVAGCAGPAEGSEDGGRAWTMTGVDPEGCDFRRGGVVARLDFDRPLDNPDSIRTALYGLVGR